MKAEDLRKLTNDSLNAIEKEEADKVNKALSQIFKTLKEVAEKGKSKWVLTYDRITHLESHRDKILKRLKEEGYKASFHQTENYRSESYIIGIVVEW